MSRDDTAHSAPLVEFLNTLPSPLTTTLVALAPTIARVRYVAQLLGWKATWTDCWLFLAAWWAICLVPELALRYILPVAVPLLFLRLRANPKTTQEAPPVTEDTLQRAISDLTIIHALTPSLPVFTQPYTPPMTVILRTIAWLYTPYLLVTYLVRIRILVALTGTLVLTWNARWSVILRRALWRSSYFRWSVYRAWSTISGQPLPPIKLSPQFQSDAKLVSVASTSPLAPTSTSASPALPDTSVRFLFTIYENQRWWMGLDWTAALLPGERPSWCSASQQPAAPPSSFTLPAATTVYTPAPDGTRRVKRTARWRWEEHEWRVVVRREGAGTSRVERPLPSAKEESTAAASASRILKAAGKMGEKRSDKEGQKAEEEGAEHGGPGSVDAHGHSEAEEEEEPLTDPDGWVYADNKWEGASCKGGLGKYTRFRRWTRIAVLTETVEIVEPGELGIQRDEPVYDPHHPPPTAGPVQAASSPATAVSAELAQAESAKTDTSADKGGEEQTKAHHAPSASRSSIASLEEEGSRLRQRLKAAVMGATGHSGS
ncbi:integral peroxisomal membrane peroxin-domain-containing protein [Daedaleopsis nitida]|nr:integral peroxisomal membrane peroxin-domain-containing protein [Daedaleopsis nitida]